MNCPYYEQSSGEDTDGDCVHPVYYLLGCDNCPFVIESEQAKTEPEQQQGKGGGG